MALASLSSTASTFGRLPESARVFRFALAEVPDECAPREEMERAK
jgi:hypothetical protein